MGRAASCSAQFAAPTINLRLFRLKSERWQISICVALRCRVTCKFVGKICRKNQTSICNVICYCYYCYESSLHSFFSIWMRIFM